MNLYSFIQKYSEKKSEFFKNNSDFDNDFNELKLNIVQDIYTINLAVEQFVEHKLPIQSIKSLISLNKDNDLILNNKNLFKWACAFHGTSLINYFHATLKTIDYEGAINAAITHHRLDNFLLLAEINPTSVFQEKNFVKVVTEIYRATYPPLNMFDFYLSNTDKFVMTNYSENTINNNQSLLSTLISDYAYEYQYNNNKTGEHTINYLLSSNYPIVYPKRILSTLSNSNNLDLIKKFLELPKFQDTLTQDMMDYFLCEIASNAKENINLEIVKYVTDNKKLPFNSNLYCQDNTIFKTLCSKSNKPFVQYILNSEKSKTAINTKNLSIGFVKHLVFKENSAKNDEFSKYLIFDVKIKKTKIISNHLIEFPEPDISKMFLTREINEQLNLKLLNKKENQKLKI